MTTPTGYQFDNGMVRVATTGTIMYLDDNDGAKYGGVQKYLEDPSKNLVAADSGGLSHLGFLSDDAVEHEFSDDTQDITSWQGGVVRTVIKSRTASFKLASLETSRQALELFYGSTIVKAPVGTGFKLSVGSNVARRKLITCFEFKDGFLPDGVTERIYRIILPSSQVTELESPKFTASDAVTWGMTIKALGSGFDLVTLISNDPALAPPTSSQSGS